MAGAVVVTTASALALTGLTGLTGEQPVAGVAVPAALPRPGPSWSTDPIGQGSAEAAEPTRVRVPAIGVDNPVVDVGVDGSGALVPPSGPDDVGWFTGGAAPGGIGSALMAGHVDGRGGPAVFFRLADLRPGDEVLVDRADGSTVAFVVDSTTRVAKTAFPTELVYAPLPTPLLRLVTCGGSLDTAAHSYRDNVIVEASPR